MATSDVTTRADPLSPGCRGLANPGPESFHSRAPAARKVVLSLGTWNVRTLVDTDGNLNTASKAKKSRKVCSNIREERKIDLVCRQLKKYGMDIVGLQETLWFGSHQYTVGDCLQPQFPPPSGYRTASLYIAAFNSNYNPWECAVTSVVGSWCRFPETALIQELPRMGPLSQSWQWRRRKEGRCVGVRERYLECVCGRACECMCM